MLNGITFNFLVWEDKNIPFPSEVQPFITADFYERVWNTAGLPQHGAKYSVVNGVLYLEEDPVGNTGIREQDFTGEILLGTFLESANENEDSFLISFKVTFVKGRVTEIVHHQTERQNTAAYQAQLRAANEKLGKSFLRRSKWWYNWLYNPYYLIVRGIALLLCWLLMVIRNLVLKITMFLTPW